MGVGGEGNGELGKKRCVVEMGFDAKNVLN